MCDGCSFQLKSESVMGLGDNGVGRLVMFKIDVWFSGGGLSLYTTCIAFSQGLF